jgi:transposase
LDDPADLPLIQFDHVTPLTGCEIISGNEKAAVVDTGGTLLKEARIPNDLHEIERFFADIDHAKIAVESSSAWYHIHELLSKRHQVVLSNPVKTKAIASAKVKTDRVDALMLANLLREGYIAESYVPSRRVMDLREMVRHRAGLVRIRTSLKNKIHAHLLMHGSKVEGTPFTKAYMDKLRAIRDYYTPKPERNILTRDHHNTASNMETAGTETIKDGCEQPKPQMAKQLST